MAITNFQMGSNQTYIGETFISPLTMAAGSNNTFIDCTFEQQNESYNWSCFVITAKNNVSSVNNKFIGCTFNGGLEEQAGADNSSTTALWEVTSIDGSEVTLSIVRDVYNKRDAYGVGAHFVILRGDNIGNYYEVTARSGDTFTVSSDKFDASDIHVGDHATVVMAVVDCEWVDCTAITTKSRTQRNIHWKGLDWIWKGSGMTSVMCGFSNYGWVFGSKYENCEVIGDGWTEVGGTTGKAIEVTQTGFWSRGVIQHNHSSADVGGRYGVPETDPLPTGINYHTSFIGCKTSGVDQSFNGGVYQLGLHNGEYMFPPQFFEDVLGQHQRADYPSSHLLVDSCDFTGGQFKNIVLNSIKSQWVDSGGLPTTKFDISVQRFGTVWASEYPVYFEDGGYYIQNPFPSLAVDIGDQSVTDWEFDSEGAIGSPTNLPLYLGELEGKDLYLGELHAVGLYFGETKIY